MTRDEAMEKLLAATRNECTEGQMLDFLDMAEALGLLKFEEPRSVESRVVDAFIQQSTGGNAVMAILREAGLKIVAA